MKISRKKLYESVCTRLQESLYTKDYLLTLFKNSIKAFNETAPEVIDRWLSYNIGNQTNYDLSNDDSVHVWYTIDHFPQTWDAFIEEISDSYDFDSSLYTSDRLKREKNSNPKYQDLLEKTRDEVMGKLEKGGVFEDNKFKNYDALVEKVKSCGFKDVRIIKGRDSKVIFDDYLEKGLYVYALVSRNYGVDYFDQRRGEYVRGGTSYLFITKFIRVEFLH